MGNNDKPLGMSENAWIERKARDLLAKEYDDPATGHEGPYPTYAGLARSGFGAFTLCSIRAVMRGIEYGMSRAASPPLGMSGGVREAAEALLLAMDARALRGHKHVPSMRDEQDARLRLRNALAATPTPPIEGRDADVERVIAEAIGKADAAFGYSFNLTRLVDGEATHTLTMPGFEPVDFEDRDEGYALIAERRNAMRAAAIRAALQALGERPHAD